MKYLVLLVARERAGASPGEEADTAVLER